MTSASTLHLSPDRDVRMVGQSLEVDVLVDSDEDIYATEAYIAFDPEQLSVENISTDGSIVSLWPTPPAFNNEEGGVVFSGWLEQRFSGSSGLLLTISFTVLRSGTSDVNILSGAALASDGGSNIINSMEGGAYTLEPTRVTPDPIPFIFPEEDEAVSATEAPLEESETVASENEDQDALTAERELSAPIFEEYPSVLTAPDRMIVRGSAYPDTQIVVRMERGGEIVQEGVLSASDGSFTFISDQVTERGVYRVWATAVDDYGAESPSSESITISVETSGMTALVALTAEIIPAFMSLLVLLIASGLFVGYVAHQRKVRHL